MLKKEYVIIRTRNSKAHKEWSIKPISLEKGLSSLVKKRFSLRENKYLGNLIKYWTNLVTLNLWFYNVPISKILNSLEPKTMPIISSQNRKEY